MKQEFDVIVIGGGQSGLAVAYYLRRTNLSYIILDNEKEAGGAWQHAWQSLRLFSPAQWSSLPGTIMQGGQDYYPSRDEAIEYLRGYEIKYNLSVRRPVTVEKVTKQEDQFILETSDGIFKCKALVSATGSYKNPYIPPLSGLETFKGGIIHSSQYKSPKEFKDQRVAIVGEGNSGAQILAEVSKITETLWITKNKPRFLPDEVDGRYLFDAATRMYEAKKQGKDFTPPSIGDIVMVPPVKEARERGVLKNLPPFKEFGMDCLVWEDGHEEKIDAIIFCTGFRPALYHLKDLGLSVGGHKVSTVDTKAREIEGLWLVGYGNWTGFASATLIGVGRSARNTVEEIERFLSHQ